MTLGKTCRLLAPSAGDAASSSLAGCGGNQNTLAAKSHVPSTRSRTSFGSSSPSRVVGFGIIALLLFLGWWRRDAAVASRWRRRARRHVRRARRGSGTSDRAARGALHLVGPRRREVDRGARASHRPPMTIQVIGHQWWWEVRYPGTDVVTANEIHIPIHTRVDVAPVDHADVIHSFWVPELNRKIDMIPGRANTRC